MIQSRFHRHEDNLWRNKLRLPNGCSTELLLLKVEQRHCSFPLAEETAAWATAAAAAEAGTATATTAATQLPR